MATHDLIMGAAGGGVVTPSGAFIEDVFSTYTYTGNGASQTITNGIDLSTNGGLVWTKGRNAAQPNSLFDTNRGANKHIYIELSNAEETRSTALTAFNNNGFTLGQYGDVNSSGTTMVSWTFRKQKKFFDIVTYTGNGVAGRQIPHNLESAPGFMIIKRLSGSGTLAYHRSIPITQYLELSSSSSGNSYNLWNNTAPTATHFTTSSDSSINGNGINYVAYLFAHNAGGFGISGTDNAISCGSFTTDATGNAAVTLGFEPQWLLVKRSDGGSGSWYVIDNVRGWAVTNGLSNGAVLLQANASSAEIGPYQGVDLSATGFRTYGGYIDGSAGYVYVAIRRGPMRAPTSGTSVFSVNLLSPSAGAPTTLETGFPVDLNLSQLRAGAERLIVIDRVRGTTANIGCKYLQIGTATENSPTSNGIGLNMTSITDNFWGPYIGYTTSVVHWSLRRAPSFFDIVTYTGNGAGAAARAIPHNLGVTPELIICKYYSGAAPSGTNWYTYSAGLTSPTTQFLRFDTTGAQATSTIWASTAPTAANFTVATDTLNFSGTNYIAYLFATCPGVSKVGTYTGNGTSLTVDCGFSTGARFVLIKRIDTIQNWIAFDSARGIVAGNDPFIATNTNTAETTTLDAIDPVSSGFIINNVSGGGNISGGKYIFLAIA